jgi:hypothetical protein
MGGIQKTAAVFLCAAALGAASCTGGLVDKRVTVTVINETGRETADIKYVAYTVKNALWLVCWQKDDGKAMTFRLDPGDYTIGLFAETTREEVEKGGSGRFAQKDLTLTGDCELVFTADDCLDG